MRAWVVAVPGYCGFDSLLNGRFADVSVFWRIMEKMKLFAYGLVAAGAFAMASSPVFARWDSLAALATGNATGAALSVTGVVTTGATADAYKHSSSRGKKFVPLVRLLNYFGLIFKALMILQALIVIFLLLDIGEVVSPPPDVTYVLGYLFQIIAIGNSISTYAAVKSFTR